MTSDNGKAVSIALSSFLLAGCAWQGVWFGDATRSSEKAPTRSAWLTSTETPNPAIYNASDYSNVASETHGNYGHRAQSWQPKVWSHTSPPIYRNRQVSLRRDPVGSPRYASPVFDSGVQSALRSDLRIRSRQLELEKAEEQFLQAKKGRLPELSLSGSIGYAFRESKSSVASVGDTSSDRETGRVRASLSQPIYQGGRISAEIRRAEAQIDASRQRILSIASDVVLESIEAHLLVLRDLERLNIYDQNVANLAEQEDNASLLVQYGEATEADLALVQARLQSAIVDVEEARLALRSSKTKYEFLTGNSGDNISQINFPPPPSSFEQAVREVLQTSTELRQITARREAAVQNVDIVKAGAKPTLSLDGNVEESLGTSDIISRNRAATVALNLRLPFNLGGQRKSEIREAAYDVSIQDMEYQIRARELRRDLKLDWESWLTARETIQLRESEIQAALFAFNSIREQYRLGVANRSELLESEEDLLRSRIRLVDAVYNRDRAIARILSVSGRLSQTSPG